MNESDTEREELKEVFNQDTGSIYSRPVNQEKH